MIKTILIFLSVVIVLAIIKKILKKDNFIIKIITPLIQVISAIVIGIFLIPIGFLYDLGKSIKELKGWNILKSIWGLIKQTLLSISWVIGRVAVGIDMLGNAVAGEMLEDIITSKEDTLFRRGEITISASVGKLKKEDKLNKVGRIFDKMLDLVFEKNHSIIAYEGYIKNR